MTGPRSGIVRLLIVADEDSCASIRALLRGRMITGPLIDCIADAQEAIRVIEERRHEVCLVEHSLDAAQGGAVVAAVVTSGAAPLVLLGGNRDSAVEQAVLAAGAADFLWKEELSAPLVESVLRHALAVRDRLRLERQLHLGQRLETVGRLAGGIAHEFNNILTAIVGFGTLLAERLADDEVASAQMREILIGAERASTLTRDLLAFSRRQVLRPTRLDLAEVVQHLGRMLRGVLGSQIQLQVRCAERLPAVRADRAQLEQAITTLAVNARDAMAGGGRLTIELDEVTLTRAYSEAHVSATPGRHVRLCVSDTGSGISKDRLARVFEPFFNARETTNPGLGLSMVYGIVKQSGGNIWVYSEPGVGTSFKLYFPVDVAEAAAEAVQTRGEAPGGSETILLVDDADIVRRLARDVLSRAGYRVLEAGGADEALQVAGSLTAPIDLLVTDIVMPGVSGLELAGQLRAARENVRVLYTSGYTDTTVVRDGLLAQDAAFLQKPFTPEDLLRKVREVLAIC